MSRHTHIHLHIHIHIHIHIHHEFMHPAHTHKHIYTYTYIHSIHITHIQHTSISCAISRMGMHIQLCTYNKYINIHIHTYIHAYILRISSTNEGVRISINIHTHTCKYTHTYCIHTRIHIICIHAYILRITSTNEGVRGVLDGRAIHPKSVMDSLQRSFGANLSK
jgi:hypothetical protein